MNLCFFSFTNFTLVCKDKLYKVSTLLIFFRFGGNYTIKIRLEHTDDLNQVLTHLRQNISSHVQVVHSHHLTATIEVGRGDHPMPLYRIYLCLEQAKAFGVVEFDVAQTTLDQVKSIIILLRSYRDCLTSYIDLNRSNLRS